MIIKNISFNVNANLFLNKNTRSQLYIYIYISDQKHKCEKGAKFGTNGFVDKRIEI